MEEPKISFASKAPADLTEDNSRTDAPAARIMISYLVRVKDPAGVTAAVRQRA